MYSDDCPIHDIIYTLSDGSTDTVRNTGGPIITTTILNMVKGAVIRMGIIKNPPYEGIPVLFLLKKYNVYDSLYKL